MNTGLLTSRSTFFFPVRMNWAEKLAAAMHFTAKFSKTKRPHVTSNEKRR